MLVRSIILLVAFMPMVSGFLPVSSSVPAPHLLFAANEVEEEAAAVLTEFMARAHEEKIRAMERIDHKYQDEVAELKAKVAELEGPSTGSDATSSNSYAFPANNKLLTEKVAAYQKFISDYIVKSGQEKQKAVQDAEAELSTKYETIIKDLQHQGEDQK